MDRLSWLPCCDTPKKVRELAKAFFILGEIVGQFKTLEEMIDDFFSKMAKQVDTKDLPQFIVDLQRNNSPAWVYFENELKRRKK